MVYTKSTNVHSQCSLSIFKPTDRSNEMYKLSPFLYTKVKVEEPYKTKSIIQCLNCQEYDHIRAYCGYPPFYVSCSAFHPSIECIKSRDPPAKCALCSGELTTEAAITTENNYIEKLPYTILFFYTNSIKLNLNIFNIKHIKLKKKKNITVSSHTYCSSNFQSTTSLPPIPTSYKIKVLISFIVDFKPFVNLLISILTHVISSYISQK